MFRSLTILIVITILLISCNGINPVREGKSSPAQKKEPTLKIKVIARADIDTLSIPKEQFTDGMKRCHYIIVFENVGNTDTCIYADSAKVIDIYKVRTHEPNMNGWSENYSFHISRTKILQLPPHSKSYFILPWANPKNGVWNSIQFITPMASCKARNGAFIKVLYTKDTTFSSPASYADRTQ